MNVDSQIDLYFENELQLKTWWKKIFILMCKTSFQTLFIVKNQLYKFNNIHERDKR